jgi:general L-amino acid transport system substrate-binding protein
MKVKNVVVFVGLMVLLLLVAACTEQPPTGETVEVTREVIVEVTRIVESAPAGGEEAAPAPVQAAPGEILQRVRDRGRVVCGGRTDLAGFGYLDEAGNTVGFDVDLCRAVAVALFNDPEAVEIVNLTAADRGPALQTGEVDILSRNTTWSSTRDAQWGNFTIITFYDGQGFMVQADSGIESIEDLDGATICVTSGTTTQLNLADAFRQRGLDYTDNSFEDTATVYSTYEGGGCDAATSDISQLAAIQSGLQDPGAHRILDITISKEPLTSAVPHGDDQWFDLVKTVIAVLINAEELGINSGNVDEMMTSENIEVRRLLGQEGEFGQADLGLDADFAANIIRALGNYGEIYDRYMGPEGAAFTLERGLNNLWTEGGLIYAMPLR